MRYTHFNFINTFEHKFRQIAPGSKSKRKGGPEGPSRWTGDPDCDGGSGALSWLRSFMSAGGDLFVCFSS